MNIHSTIHFDILNFINELRKLGVDEKVATCQARQIERVTNEFTTIVEQQNMLIHEQASKVTALESKELSTKGDVRESELRLQKEIEVVRKEIEVVRKEIEVVRKEISDAKIWLLLIGSGAWVSILAILAKGFHWF
jgi:hypothetical protein